MTALNPSPAADDLPGSQLATGAYPGARRLLFQIVGGKPNPAGNTAAPKRFLPVSAQYPFRSLKRQTLNQTGSQCSERNKTIPVRVGNDADLRAGRAHLSRKRPVFRLLSMVARGQSLVGHRYQPSSVISQTPVSCVQSPVLQSEIGTGDWDNASHGE